MSLPDPLFIFVNHSNFITENRLRLTGTFTSSAWLQTHDPEFLKKYLEGTADYFPYVPNGQANDGTSGYSPFVPNNQADLHMVSPFFMTAISDFLVYAVEYDAELYRRQHFPCAPSRFSAIYAFGDYESCLKCSEKHRWDINTVEKFEEFCPHPAFESLSRHVRVNMGIVSLARTLYGITSLSLSSEQRDTIWDHYWQGKGNLKFELPSQDGGSQVIESGELWEYLIEGQVKLKDDQ